jgi:hypothetical protein
MAKVKGKVVRVRKPVTMTLDPGLVKMARSIGDEKSPPWTLARVMDDALHNWIVANGPKGKGAK